MLVNVKRGESGDNSFFRYGNMNKCVCHGEREGEGGSEGEREREKEERLI